MRNIVTTLLTTLLMSLYPNRRNNRKNNLLKKMRIKYLFVAILVSTGLITAQNTNKNFSINGSLEFNTRYIWRGIHFSNSPVLFPSLGLEYNGLALSSTAGYALDGKHTEIDFSLSYSNRGFTIGINDYFMPSSLSSDNYFDFDTKSTYHSVETYLTYSLAKIPLWFTASCFVYGNDRDTNLDNFYSTYIETGYVFNFKKKGDISLILGVTPFKGTYAESFNVVNITAKYDYNLHLSNLKVPLSASLIANPSANKVYLTFSFFITTNQK